mmetsp:Transcript_3227/g.7551  ORF Transcript_3227/g.7551 Transcript_3227/m.7551 type:complete len:84 (+) Transcript_3227:157-408(+)
MILLITPLACRARIQVFLIVSEIQKQRVIEASRLSFHMSISNIISSSSSVFFTNSRALVNASRVVKSSSEVTLSPLDMLSQSE